MVVFVFCAVYLDKTLNHNILSLGNHDLDFGLVEFNSLRNQCNFPWICSNSYDAKSNEPLGGCHEYIILNDDCTAAAAAAGEDDDNCDKARPKILVIGLIEKDWLDTLSSVDPSNIIFESPTDYFKRRVPEIKALHGPFDAVVAVSHMRVPQDKSFAVDIGGGLEGVDISKLFLFFYVSFYIISVYLCFIIVRSLIIIRYNFVNLLVCV